MYESVSFTHGYGLHRRVELASNQSKKRKTEFKTMNKITGNHSTMFPKNSHSNAQILKKDEAMERNGYLHHERSLHSTKRSITCNIFQIS